MLSSAMGLKKIFIVFLPLLMPSLYNTIFMISVANHENVLLYGSLVFIVTYVSLFVAFSDLGLRDYYLTKEGGVSGENKSVNLFFLTLLIYFFLSIIFVVYEYFQDGNALLCLMVIFELLSYAVFQKTLYYESQYRDKLELFSLIDLFIKSVAFSVKIVSLYILGLEWSILLSALTLVLLYGVASLQYRFYLGFSKFIRLGLSTIIKERKTWLKYTLSFFSFFFIFSVDKIIIKSNLGIEALAVYASAFAMFSFGQIVVSSIWAILLPQVSSGRVSLSWVVLLMLLSMGGALITFYNFSSGILYDILYPDTLKNGADILNAISIYFIFRFFNLFGELLAIKDATYVRFTNYRLLAMLLFVVLVLFAIDEWGVIGVAYSIVFSEFVVSLLLVRSVVTSSGLPFKGLLR
ncbi:hypothetical protein [Thalassolituus sp.]|jgi:O-antigen/teichoic acid export membrane protein|uniref:hypothetical protein n=1 Tax=Thalassolituus sp. TaxID=2030822 RepID=UPI0035159D8C